MSEKKRMANLELLRCVAMMMVVMLHYLGKGGLLPKLTEEGMSSTGIAAWLLEAFSTVAVNVYMLISGYVLCNASFRLRRLFGLLLQVWLYSVIFGVFAAAAGIVRETAVDTHYFLTLLFPVLMRHYWFVTAYVFLYLLLPFLGTALQKMAKRQMQLAIALFLTVFCLSKSILPLRLEMDSKGFDFLWYFCVFVTAAYIRRFGLPILKTRKRALCLYAVCSLLAFGGNMALQFIYIRTGRLDNIQGLFMEYNHVLPFLAALGLFWAFVQTEVNDKITPVINKIAPHTLGVYLLHENMGLRYTWQKWLMADRISSVGELLFYSLSAVVCVFVCGILIDMLRVCLTKGIHALLCRWNGYRKLTARIEKADALFREVS